MALQTKRFWVNNSPKMNNVNPMHKTFFISISPLYGYII